MIGMADARVKPDCVNTEVEMSSVKKRIHTISGGVEMPLIWVTLACALLFAALTLIVAYVRGPLPFDRPVSVAVQSVNVGWFSPVNSFIGAFAGTTGIVAGICVIILVFLFRRPATPFAIFSAMYSLIYNGFELLIRRPRPTGLVHETQHLGAYSFPSGHVAFFLWIATLVFLLSARKLSRRGVVAAWVGVTLVVIVTALSRIYVGAHWSSDAIGGFLVGLGWMAMSLAVRRLTRPLVGDATAVEVLTGHATS